MLKNVLQPRKKYTIMRFDDKGWPRSFCFILTYVSIKSDRTTLITSGSARDLKWDKFITLLDNAQYVIWGGWHKVNTAICVSRGMDVGGCICERRWSYGDPRYLLRAKKELGICPVAENIEPLQPERLIIYQTISEKQ